MKKCMMGRVISPKESTEEFPKACWSPAQVTRHGEEDTGANGRKRIQR
jgi:hypothetical protein